MNRQPSSRTPVNGWRSRASAVAISTRSACVRRWAESWGRARSTVSSPVATISFRCWQTRFGADPNVIGQTFRLQGELVTVIGVAPRAFTGLEVGMPTDAWVPASLAPRLHNEPPGLSFFAALVGRLRPGVTLQQARTQLESLWPPARQAAAAVIAASLPQARRRHARPSAPNRVCGPRFLSIWIQSVLSAHSGVAGSVQRDHHRAVLRESLGPAARAMVDARGRSGGAGGARRVQRPLGVPGGRRIAGPVDGRGRAQRATRPVVSEGPHAVAVESTRTHRHPWT